MYTVLMPLRAFIDSDRDLAPAFPFFFRAQSAFNCPYHSIFLPPFQAVLETFCLLPTILIFFAYPPLKNGIFSVEWGRGYAKSMRNPHGLASGRFWRRSRYSHSSSQVR